MTAAARILLIMDDDLLRQTVADHLAGAMGLVVVEARTAHDGLAAAPGCDLILVDESGQDQALCRSLRDNGVTAPLLLLAADAPAGCVADAVVTKPLRLSALAAKITELLTRRPDPVGLCIGPWRLDAAGRHLTAEDGRRIRLTDKETAILCRLGRAAGQVVAREVLLAEIWGYSAQMDTHTLETHIYRLRRKIEGGSRLLIGENGGYRLS